MSELEDEFIPGLGNTLTGLRATTYNLICATYSGNNVYLNGEFEQKVRDRQRMKNLPNHRFYKSLSEYATMSRKINTLISNKSVDLNNPSHAFQAMESLNLITLRSNIPLRNAFNESLSVASPTHFQPYEKTVLTAYNAIEAMRHLTFIYDKLINGKEARLKWIAADPEFNKVS